MMEVFRCPGLRCGRKLIIGEVTRVQIKCPKCKRTWLFEGSPSRYTEIGGSAPQECARHEQDTFPR